MVKQAIKTIIPKTLWTRIRKRRIIKDQRRVAQLCDGYIEKYYSTGGKLFCSQPKKDLKGRKIIWQYWAQGYDGELPTVVQDCMKSVDKYRGDYEVVRLSDKTIGDYVDLPDYVWKKREHGFSVTAFSNVLRLALLNLYGGVWVDATVLLTGTIPERYATYDFFMFQRDENEPNKLYWEQSYAYYWGWGNNFKVRVLTSIIFAKCGCLFIEDYLNLLLYVWRENDKYPFYFTFQILFNQLVESGKAGMNCPIENDCLPHYLMQIINDCFPYANIPDAVKKISIHKLTFKNLNIAHYNKAMEEISKMKDDCTNC